METKPETIVPAPEKPLAPKPSREPLFGKLLFALLILLILGTIGVLVWGGYHGFRMTKEEAALPSIATLPREEVTEAVVTPEEPAKEAESVKPTFSEDQVKKAKATDLKVLNGGAAKGSAGTLAETLKKAGYTKAVAGNTLKDYTGTVVYFATGLDTEAAIVKEALLATYPKAEVKPADKGNTETTQAPLTIILGK